MFRFMQMRHLYGSKLQRGLRLGENPAVSLINRTVGRKSSHYNLLQHEDNINKYKNNKTINKVRGYMVITFMPLYQQVNRWGGYGVKF